ncbi:hypothetical protein GCM10025867_26970 [Frondihabitans sucicola]|uniref:Bacteriophage T5 Orf172 DNA-binding domain-containing protein n=1 Tax=Frondihabitans sucicola TaxID=1268041 RepID=A0ABN6XZT9_9MICO|nr:GIY-YIG nuclease family protein [Frondihabitans sucicola]BDZ50456.1 hypothetical protein GCM10025867_26970 [Frondihabitans sucicola]
MSNREVECRGAGSAGACSGPVTTGAPVPLCDRHLAVAHDWVDEAHGVVDLADEPCPACGSFLAVRYPSGRACGTCEWRFGDVIDSELPAPRVDVVYYLRFDGRIKIGTSSNPRQRLSRLWHDELLAFERGDRRVEHARHVQFAACRLASTEWFDRSPELEAHVAELSAGQPDPWQAYARWMSAALALRV